MPFTTHIQNKWQLEERKTLWEWRENRREKKKQFNCNRNQEERSTIKRYVRARSASLMISQKWYLFARFFFFKTANNTSPSAKIQVQYVEKKSCVDFLRAESTRKWKIRRFFHLFVVVVVKHVLVCAPCFSIALFTFFAFEESLQNHMRRRGDGGEEDKKHYRMTK